MKKKTNVFIKPCFSGIALKHHFCIIYEYLTSKSLLAWRSAGCQPELCKISLLKFVCTSGAPHQLPVLIMLVLSCKCCTASKGHVPLWSGLSAVAPDTPLKLCLDSAKYYKLLCTGQVITAVFAAVTSCPARSCSSDPVTKQFCRNFCSFSELFQFGVDNTVAASPKGAWPVCQIYL